MPCECRQPHARRRRIVLTGGPGAGKTAVLETLKHELCEHVTVLPEAAGIVFGGGFPRLSNTQARSAVQRAIFFVQRELEDVADSTDPAIVLCDRGLVDSAAYWPGPGDLWSSVGFSREDALRRYDVVIHLRVPDTAHGYGHQNPLRLESATEAAAIDERILRAWDGHPRRFIVDASHDFLEKSKSALAIIRDELPECCSRHVAAIDLRKPAAEPSV